MKRKLLSILITLSLVFSLLPVTALAAYTDTQGHWAQEAIDKWSGLGIIKGSGGSFRPDDPITRGEMAVIIDRLMKYQTAAENSFTDLGQDFYTEAILKANAAGIITGYGAQVRPADNITREEAVVMLCRAFGIAPSNAPSGFADSAGVSSWASGYVSAMAAKGYIQGSQGMFNPKSSIKRAEIVTILNNAVSGFFTEAKEYTGDISGIAIVNTSGVVLNDMTITGDLIIAEGVGSGDVTLRNVVVTGNTIVRGGGANSIHIVGNSKISNLIIEKTDSGQIRVVAQDGSAVEAVFVDDGNDDIILTGTFESVSINASVSVKVVDAQIAAVKVTGENSRIEIDTASTVGTLTAEAPVSVSNNGTIAKAEVNVDNVTIDGNKPAETTYATGVAGAKDEDTTPSGGGGGGGGGSRYIAVTGVTVSPTTLTLVVGGPAETITATVTPDDATDKTVTWSSSDETVATVDNGVVTPVGVGTATITAAAGGKSATVAVTVIPVDVTGITVDKDELILVVGGPTETVTATVAPDDATDKTVTWSSSDETVATVANGVVTPVGAGTAVITATAGGRSATVSVMVADVLIETIDDLTTAIDNQADGQFWIIKGGLYDLPRGTQSYNGQAGWYFPITADNLTILGIGNPVLTSTTESPNGAHASQNLITVWGDNVTLQGLTLEPKVEENKTVEVIGENFTIKNCTFRPNSVSANADTSYGGSLYFSGVKDQVLVEGNTFNYTSVAFDNAYGKLPDSSVVVRGNTWENIGYYAVGNVFWGSGPYTNAYADVLITGNAFNNVTDSTTIINARMNQTLILDGSNTINGSAIDKETFGKYINFNNLARYILCKDNVVIVDGKVYESPYKEVDAYAETFSQLAAAIASAGDGDVIMLGNKEFVGNLTITKPVKLVSLTPLEAVIKGSITIQNTSGVTIEGLTVNAGAGYDKLPVIHIINSADITIRDNAVNATPGSMQLSIGTSTGPAKVTGVVSGNTVYGAIGLGTEGNLSVTGNTVTYASHEGIWFYPVGAQASLTITGNAVAGFGSAAPGSAAIKVESRPASINGVTDDLNMQAAIANANGGVSVKLTWMKTAGDASQLANGIASARAGDIIVISGQVGGPEDYTYYEITKPITIKGISPDAAVYGSFIIKCDGVTIDGLTIYTRGGGEGPLKNAIDVIAKTVTITNNTFVLPNPDALADNGGVGNGVVIWPVGSAAPDYTVSGNTFIGYSADTSSWSSTALQITEGLDLKRFNMAGTVSQAITLDTETETALAAGNTYTACTNNYIRSDWSSGSVVYKFVYAATEDQLDSGFQYGGDGVTIVLAAGTYGLTEQRDITKPMTLIGLGQVTLQAQNESWSNVNGYKHLLSVYAGTAENPVVISNITLDSQGYAYGFHAYRGPVVILNDVTVINSKGAGLTVNGSTVTANNLNTSGNTWGAVNVDPGKNVTLPSVFNLTGSGTLSENQQIWSDGKNVTSTATVTVNADGYQGYKAPDSPVIIWTNRGLPSGAGILGDNNVLTMYDTIQGAFTAAKAGDTIKVMPGTYKENVSVSKAVTLLGAGADVTKIVGTDGNKTPLTFNTNNATVSGFTITHEYTQDELNAWNFNNNGVIFHQGKTGNTLKDCVVTLNRNGIYINNATGNTIKDNIITKNRTGINMTNTVDGTLITGNTISDNWTLGLVYYQQGSATNFDTVTVTGNTFDGNWYSEILIKDTSSSTGTLDVSGNTFTDSPVTYTISADSSLNEPAFDKQKPAALGGDAVKPAADLPTLRIYSSPNVTLQYAGKQLVVGDSTGDFASITDALAVAADGDTILVGADMTLGATLVINTPGITIDGQGHSINQAIHINADGVTIKNLTGSANGIFVGGPTAFYITAKDVTLDNITVIGSNEPKSIAVRGYKGAEFTVTNSSFSNFVTGIFAHHGYSEPDAGHNILIATNNTFTNVLAGIGGTQKTTLTATGNTFVSVQYGGEGIGLGDGVVIVGAETATPEEQVAYLAASNIFLYTADNAGAYHVRDWRTPAMEEFSDDAFMMGMPAPDTGVADGDTPDADAQDAGAPDAGLPDAAPPEVSKPDVPAPDESDPDTTDPDGSGSDGAAPGGTAPEVPDGEA